MSRASVVAALLVGVFLTGASALEAQSQDRPPPRPDTTEAELVFEREVYSYPTYGRRNPFQPLTSGDASGPRFEELRLLGVIFSDNAATSVALLGIDVVGGTAGRTYRVRRGDRLGNTRILSIQRDRVLVEVEEFGLTEQRQLQVRRPREGGSQ